MKNLTPKVVHNFESICFVIFANIFFLSTSIGQIITDEYVFNVDIDVDSIENCFGYKLLNCSYLPVYRSGVYKKNRSIIEFECDENGQISNFELSFNNNYSLDSQEIANCVLPYINLSTRTIKRRYKTFSKNTIMLIFDNEINEENEKYYCLESLRKTKKNTIDYFKEERRLKSHVWDLNITKFNTLVNDKDANSIFIKLVKQSTEMLNEHLKNCDRDKTQLNKTQHKFQSLRTRINDRFQMILNDYFKKKQAYNIE